MSETIFGSRRDQQFYYTSSFAFNSPDIILSQYKFGDYVILIQVKISSTKAKLCCANKTNQITLKKMCGRVVRTHTAVSIFRLLLCALFFITHQQFVHTIQYVHKFKAVAFLYGENRLTIIIVTHNLQVYYILTTLMYRVQYILVFIYS